jgi:hypothetical protein
LQFLVVSNGYGGMMVPAEATPGAGQMPMPSEAMPAGPPQLTEAQLGPIVEALVTAGAPREVITVTVPSAASEIYGPGGPGMGEVRVTLDHPRAEHLAGLVQAALEAASGAGLQVMHVGAGYDAADCNALVQQAREAAVADARKRAEGMARALGTTLGELTQAVDSPYFAPSAMACAPEGMPGDYVGPYGPGAEPTFDPAMAGQAVTYVQVTLTYDFGPSTATPSA